MTTKTKATKATKATKKSRSPIRVGNAVLIRTVTMYHTGHIIEITPLEIILEDAAWVADMERFHDALKTGTLREVEPFIHEVAVNRGAIVDVTSWPNDLPRTQK